MLGKGKTKGINLKDIYTGRVVLIKEYDEGEKIPSSNVVIGTNKSGKVACLQVRKIVFALKGNEGFELSSGLNKNNKYTYKVISSKDVNNVELFVKNNTLVIDNPKKVGDLLATVGFPTVVKGRDVRAIRKLVLSSDKVINIRKHELKLNPVRFIDVEQVEKANNQASSLYLFKTDKLPTKPQEIEKVYKKHFK